LRGSIAKQGRKLASAIIKRGSEYSCLIIIPLVGGLRLEKHLFGCAPGDSSWWRPANKTQKMAMVKADAGSPASWAFSVFSTALVFHDFALCC